MKENNTLPVNTKNVNTKYVTDEIASMSVEDVIAYIRGPHKATPRNRKLTNWLTCCVYYNATNLIKDFVTQYDWATSPLTHIIITSMRLKTLDGGFDAEIKMLDGLSADFKGPSVV